MCRDGRCRQHVAAMTDAYQGGYSLMHVVATTRWKSYDLSYSYDMPYSRSTAYNLERGIRMTSQL